VGFTCINTRACGKNREQFCYCDPNGKVACETCQVDDGGTAAPDGGSDAGTDGGAGLPMCPANATKGNTTCTMNADRCAANACNNKGQEVCICAVFTGTTGQWFCSTLPCQ
jgi:hypothetical protein